MYTAEPRPFTAATNKLAYAQAFSGASARRHRVSTQRTRRGLALLRGRRRTT
ncbi:MAG: hypothetical protein ACR2LX_11935 [Jatrophihabitans sp.]